MVSIAGSKKLKRQMAPAFWGITRKDKRFVTTVRPGPHPKHYSIPNAVLLRDTLKLVTTLREAKSAIYGGHVTIDGIKGILDEDSWVLVRKSNTEDIIRISVESNNLEKVKKIVQQTGDLVKQSYDEVK